MPGTVNVTRLGNSIRKRILMRNLPNQGELGANTIMAVTGRVLITHLGVYVYGDLQPAGATIELGVAGNTTAFRAQVNANTLDNGEYWLSGSTPAGTVASDVDQLIASDLIMTIGTNALTGGGLEFQIQWIALSVDGYMI